MIWMKREFQKNKRFIRFVYKPRTIQLPMIFGRWYRKLTLIFEFIWNKNFDNNSI